MPKVYRTTDELITIYTYKQSGENLKEVAQKLGLNYYSVLAAIHLLDQYIKGKPPGQSRHSPRYRAAAKLIRKQKASTAPEGPLSLSHALERPIATPKADRYSALKASFDLFQQSIAVFVEEELKSRHAGLLRENQMLRQENEQLKRRREEPQSTNWIDSLKDTLSEETT